MRNIKLNAIRKAVKANIDRMKKQTFETFDVNNEADRNALISRYTNRSKPYAGSVSEQIYKCKAAINNHYQKSLESKLFHINAIENAGEFINTVVTLEWKDNYTWGKCPKAFDNFRHETSRITGCGYCKESTAVAGVLNQNLPLIKLLCQAKERSLRKKENRSNHDIFGYGSGYGIIPQIEGGVGVSCYPKICETVGLEFKSVSWTSNTNVYTINKK